MATFLEHILDEKEKEVAMMKLEEVQPKRTTYCFYDFLRKNSDAMQLIAEVKRASPSKGNINLDVDVVSQAKRYEQAGAGAISVLTDPAYFKGSIEDLRHVSEQVSLPILCKDFIIDEKQLIRARNAGATIILLIVSALSQNQLEELFKKATNLDLEVLVEVHDEEELAIAEALGAKLIGVNNRNLHSFQVDIAVSEKLAKKQKNAEIACYISESGFRLPTDVMRVKDRYQAVLVGEALMRENDPKLAAEKLKVVK